LSDRRLDGSAALLAAERTAMRKLRGEKDTEFVKRIVNAYLDAEESLAKSARAVADDRAAYSKAKALMKELGYDF
jgi:hypothetical protein